MRLLRKRHERSWGRRPKGRVDLGASLYVGDEHLRRGATRGQCDGRVTISHWRERQPYTERFCEKVRPRRSIVAARPREIIRAKKADRCGNCGGDDEHDERSERNER